jgi:hypothetical protein
VFIRDQVRLLELSVKIDNLLPDYRRVIGSRASGSSKSSVETSVAIDAQALCNDTEPCCKRSSLLLGECPKTTKVIFPKAFENEQVGVHGFIVITR